MDELQGLGLRMRRVVADPPPTRIDLEALIAAERSRRRTMGWSAGVGLVGAVTVAAVLPALLAGGVRLGGVPDGVAPPGVALAPGAGATTSPDDAAPSPSFCAPLSLEASGPTPPLQTHDTVRTRPTEPVDQAVPRLTESLAETLRAVVPPRFKVESTHDGCAGPQFQFRPSRREYLARLRLVYGDRVDVLVVRVLPTSSGTEPFCPASDNPDDCEFESYPDGSTSASVELEISPGLTQVTVLVQRRDGSSVLLITSKSPDSEVESSGPSPKAVRPLLTGDQLVRIGQAPGLTLCP